MYSTAPRRSATLYMASKRASASATPLTLPNSIAPRNPSWVMARSNSAADAAGSLSGSVASAVNRAPRSRTTAANASFTRRARAAARAGVSTCVPGVVNDKTCMSTPSRRAVPCENVARVPCQSDQQADRAVLRRGGDLAHGDKRRRAGEQQRHGSPTANTVRGGVTRTPPYEQQAHRHRREEDPLGVD